ncbi:hypothetical protein U0070_007828, partial [Myodes glareolus]
SAFVYLLKPFRGSHTMPEDHQHLDEEIYYIMEGSRYISVKDREDKCFLLSMGQGVMSTLPCAIYHQFTLDENYMEA